MFTKHGSLSNRKVGTPSQLLLCLSHHFLRGIIAMFTVVSADSVDCAWATWSAWLGTSGGGENCSKTASGSGTCGAQGGGTRERSRAKSFGAANGGEQCEADTMKETWKCCPDKTTDPRADPDGCAAIAAECRGTHIEKLLNTDFSCMPSNSCFCGIIPSQ